MIRLAVLAALICAVARGPVLAQPLVPQKTSAATGISIDRLDDLDFFGEAAAGIGDLDGDGIPDAAVGSPQDDDGGINRGAVWILMLNSDGTVRSQQKISSTAGGFTGKLNNFDYFGTAVSSLGDLDGDGVLDIAVGAPRDDGGSVAPTANRGSIWILFLKTDGSVKRHQKISGTEGGLRADFEERAEFGAAVAALGDFDGDGVTDLAVGASGDGGAGMGSVWILTLHSNGTVKAAQKISNGEGGLPPVLRDFDVFGAAVANVGDLDLDGVVDLAVGAPRTDAPEAAGSDVGAVWILLLNPNGTVKAQRQILGTGGNFGSSAVGLGDLAGDGTIEVLVGARTDGENDSGSAFILSLRNDATVKESRRITGLETLLDERDRFGSAVTELGDVDGDGRVELMIGVPGDDDGLTSPGGDRGAVWVLFLDDDQNVLRRQKISNTTGGFTASLAEDDRFGSAIANMGDLDGDAVPDVAVGSPRDNDGGPDRGAIWVLLLNTEGGAKAYRKISSQEGGFIGPLNDFDFFGGGVANIGDLDGDGVNDLAVGAPRDDQGSRTINSNRGAVWILFLRSDGTVKAERKIASGDVELSDRDVFGSSVASLGDFDGDGIEDMIVGAPGDGPGSSGAAWILLLNTDGSVRRSQKISEDGGGFSGRLQPFDNFGESVAAIGDLNGDGVTDVAVGAPRDGNAEAEDRGAVWILFLRRDLTVLHHQKITSSEGGLSISSLDGDHFGWSLANLGDLDGDGIVDLAAGARGDRGGRGAVWILFMNSDGTVKDHSSLSSADYPLSELLDERDYFGGAVALLGDLNRDGKPEILAGAPGDDDGAVTAVGDLGAFWRLFDIPFPPPRIDAARVVSGRPEVGRDVSITARVVAVSGVSDVTVSFRRGGDTEFFSAPMRSASGDYEFTIPAFASSSRGIEYFITATNTSGVQSRMPDSGIVAVPLFVPAGLTSPLTSGTAAAGYRLLSVPLYLEQTGARTILEDDLGAYDVKRWRLYGYEGGGSYIELSDRDLEMAPGKAFWLLVKSPGRTLTTGAGTSVSTAEPFRVVLNPGWTLVGNPFAFPVPESNFRRTSGASADIRYYDGSWKDLNDSLRPFEGVAVHNEFDVADTLLIDPHISLQSVSRTATSGDLAWYVSVTASTAKAIDSDNLAGTARQARDGWDAFDRAEPPPVGDYVSLAFAGELSVDVRPELAGRGEWKLEVKTPDPERVVLSFSGLEQVPSRYGVWIEDRLLNTRHDLRREPTYLSMTPGEHAARELALVVGERDDSPNELPLRSGITSAFPNPFADVTTIAYERHESSDVRLDMDDTLGRRVFGSDEGFRDAGRHAYIWDAEHSGATPLPNGVYFVRIETGSTADLTRVVLVR